MSESKIAQKVNQKGCIVMDGAIGTNMFDMGLVSGDAPELWNDEFPERVLNLVLSFCKAGSDMVLTNSFGGNAMRLKLHKNEHRVSELNEKATAIAREAVQRSGKDVLIAGSIGPLGELLEPLGELSVDDAVKAFTEQALALERGGADVLWIETMSSKEEILAAVEGASQTGLEFGCTASFDTKGRTMMGISPKEFIQICLGMKKQPSAVGSNCGVGPAQTVAAVLEMAESSNGRIPIAAKANCGVPEWEGEKIVYSASPEQMFTYSQIARDAGATLIGGCCGTKAEHVHRMSEALTGYSPKERPTFEQIEIRLGEVFDSTPKKARRRSRSR